MRKIIVIILLLILIQSASCLVKRVESKNNETGYIEVIVRFKQPVKRNLLIGRIPKSEIKTDFKIINGLIMKIPKEKINEIKNLPYVKNVEINSLKFRALLTETVPLINADFLQEIGYNGSGVSVCILDTGIDFFHKNIPKPVEAVDFTDWDWCIDGQPSKKGNSFTYNYSLNISSDIASLGWLEIGINWICNSTDDGLYDYVCEGGNRYDFFVYYPNGTLANGTIMNAIDEWINASNTSNYTLSHSPIVPNSVVVKNGSTILDETNYTVYYKDGKIILNEPLFVGENLTVYYKYTYDVIKEASYYWLKLNLTNLVNGTWTIVINETEINSSEDYPTLFWGSNVTNLFESYYCFNNDSCDCGTDVSKGEPPPDDIRSFYNIHPQDDYGHGTHIAGIIASNHSTYKGVAPGVSLYVAKVLDSDGLGNLEAIVKGIEWCSNRGDIISISLGAPNESCNDSAVEAVNNATIFDRTLSVIAAGNDNTTIYSPGCAKTALTVGATLKEGKKVASYSGRGPINLILKPEIVAPGGNSSLGIFSTYITNGFASIFGTSAATPHVSGAAALLLQKNPNLTPPEIKVILMNSANQTILNGKIGDLTYDFGAGLLDVLEAINTYILNDTISTGEIKSYTLNLTNSYAKVTLYWEEDKNHSSLNLSLKNLTEILDKSTNENWVTHQVGYSNISGKLKILVGGVNVSGNLNFYLAASDFIYPSTVLDLIFPKNKTYNETTQIEFKYFVNAKNLDTCHLWIGNGTYWNINKTNTSPKNNENNTFIETFSDGIYTWNVECNGSFNGISFSDFSDKNETFIIDSKPPLIRIYSPLNNSNISGDLILNWSVDDLTFRSIWYSLDDGNNITLIGKTNTTKITVDEGKHSITFYSNDSFGRVSSTKIFFTIDNTPPDLTIIYPKNETIYSDQFWLNYTVEDSITKVESVWYSLDYLNNKSLFGNTSVNLSYPGKHLLVVYANDSAGNLISKKVNFSSIFPMNFTNWTNYANSSWPEVIYLKVENETNEVTDKVANITSLFRINITTKNFNITIGWFNGTNAIWNYLFNLTEKNKSLSDYVKVVWGTNATKLIYFTDFNKFLNKCNVTITFSPNSSGYTEILFCNNLCQKIEKCGSSPCYKDLPSRTIVYLTHLSGIVVGNDTVPPFITVISPENKTYTDGNDIYNLLANLSTSKDAVYCNYTVDNKSNYSSETFLWKIGPLKNGDYNITFWCKDKYGNINNTIIYFTINDTKKPTISDISLIERSYKFVTISWNTNEPSTGKINYGESCSNLDNYEINSSYKTKHKFNLTDLSIGKKYYYKLTACDYQNNCEVKDCNSYTTFSTLDVEVMETPTAEEINAIKETFFWTKINAGEEIKMIIKNPEIPIDFIKFILFERATDASMIISFYKEKPKAIPPAPNYVYKYFDISSTFKDKIKSLEIQFSIPISWFESKNLDPDKVKVYNYNGEWKEEPTFKKGISNSNYVYLAEISHLSKFAISTIELKVEEKFNETLIQNETIQKEVVNETKKQPTKPEIRYEIFGIFILLIIFILIYLSEKIKGKREK